MFFLKSKIENIYKELGYNTDQQGIINRYLRESENWNIHLQNTKNYILQAINKAESKTVIVLGSGWLLDIPIDELSKHFEQVYLVDICHPKQVIHKISKYQNVKTIVADISGFALAVYNVIKEYSKTNKKISLNEIKQTSLNFGLPEYIISGYYISVNLLNQLDILLIDYLQKFNIYDNTELFEFRKTIQNAHLNNLSNNGFCLITDYEELGYNKDMVLEERQKLVHVNLPENENTKYWQWLFDMQMTYKANRKTIFNVMALCK